MTKFEYTPEFAQDIEAYYGITINDILEWITACENNGKLTAHHHEVDFKMESYTSWPKKDQLIFQMKLVSGGDIIDTKYTAGYIVPTIKESV